MVTVGWAETSGLMVPITSNDTDTPIGTVQRRPCRKAVNGSTAPAAKARSGTRSGLPGPQPHQPAQACVPLLDHPQRLVRAAALGTERQGHLLVPGADNLFP